MKDLAEKIRNQQNKPFYSEKKSDDKGKESYTRSNSQKENNKPNSQEDNSSDADAVRKY